MRRCVARTRLCSLTRKIGSCPPPPRVPDSPSYTVKIHQLAQNQTSRLTEKGYFPSDLQFGLRLPFWLMKFLMEFLMESSSFFTVYVHFMSTASIAPPYLASPFSFHLFRLLMSMPFMNHVHIYVENSKWAYILLVNTVGFSNLPLSPLFQPFFFLKTISQNQGPDREEPQPTGPMYFVFCRLLPFSPQPPQQYFYLGPTCHLSALN
jgi:hypothetical protein